MMAKVLGQHIPPSLIDVFAKTIKGGQSEFDGYILDGVNPKAMSARKKEDTTQLAKFATATATWMTDRWVRTADRGTRSRFYTARRSEIIRGNFNAEFWAEGVMFSDTSELSRPTVTNYTGSWNQTYWDEDRQPTACKYKDISSAYPTPTDDGTEEAPAPGWKGTVIGGKWQDLYQVQRRVDFTLQHGITKDDGRPVAIHFDWTITAEATVRGNKNWFTLIVHPIFRTTAWPVAMEKGSCARWAREDQFTKQIPGDEPGGWNHSERHRTARDGRKFAEFYGTQQCDILSLRIASPPSLGLYGSRNDDVTVRDTGNAAVYTAR